MKSPFSLKLRSLKEVRRKQKSPHFSIGIKTQNILKMKTAEIALEPENK